MFRTILVPLDGSAFGEHALPLACEIAHRTGAKLLLTHVHLPVTVLASEVAAYSVELDIEQRNSERAHLLNLAKSLRDQAGISVHTELLEAPIAPTIHDYAIDHRVDLIVMTTHGRGPLSRVWLGSVADRLVRTMTIPIILIRPHDGDHAPAQVPTFKHILIPLDGSALAEQIFEPALNLGRLVEAHYTLLQVVEPPLPSYHQTFTGDGAMVEQLQQLQASAHSYLDRISERLSAEMHQVTTAVVIGQPAPAILEYAQAHAVDLIALKTHGRGGFMRLMLGSVADKVARGANTPVLLHHPHTDK